MKFQIAWYVSFLLVPLFTSAQKKDTVYLRKEYKKLFHGPSDMENKCLFATDGLSLESFIALCKSEDFTIENSKILNWQPDPFESDKISPVFVKRAYRRNLYLKNTEIIGTLNCPFAEYGNLTARNCRIQNIHLEGDAERFEKKHELFWSRSEFIEDSLGEIRIDYLRGMLHLSRCTFNYGYLSLTSYNNSYDGFRIESCRFSRLNLGFNSDTIGNFAILTPETAGPKKRLRYERGEPDVYFRDCYIKGQIFVQLPESYNGSIVFENVTFGKNSDIANMLADSIYFINCKFEETKDLAPWTSKQKVGLYFKNTDILKLRIPFDGQYWVIPPKDAQDEDQVNLTYETLLNELKRTGKQNSYQTLDIDYKKYKYSRQSLMFRILGMVDRTWWNYGYNKEWVFGWIIVFITVFYALNFIYWKKIQRIYSIPELNFRVNVGRRTSGHRVWVSSLLYTVFIFFSISIKFDRIKHYSTGWLLFLLFQYFVGLICLFFLVNAILKV